MVMVVFEEVGLGVETFVVVVNMDLTIAPMPSHYVVDGPSSG